MQGLEQIPDPENSTEDGHRLIFDVINFSKTETLIFWDFDVGRCETRKVSHTPFIPPAEIRVPPLHMCSIPDSYYRGRTLSKRDNPEALHVFGPTRPLRRTTRFFRGKKLVTRVLPGTWEAIPMNDKAWALVEEIRARGGRL